ncbi:MAG: hypothetical protein ACLR7D_08240 [Lachnospira eligens]
MKRIIAVCMLMVLIVSQTACTFSRNNDRAVIPGSSITPAPGAAARLRVMERTYTNRSSHEMLTRVECGL